MLSDGTSRVLSTNLLIGDVLSQKTTISVFSQMFFEKFRKINAFFLHFSIPGAFLLRGLYVWFHYRTFRTERDFNVTLPFSEKRLASLWLFCYT